MACSWRLGRRAMKDSFTTPTPSLPMKSQLRRPRAGPSSFCPCRIQGAGRLPMDPIVWQGGCCPLRGAASRRARLGVLAPKRVRGRYPSMDVRGFSSRRRHTRDWRDWSSDVCSSDLEGLYDRVLPTYQVIAASGGERDLDRRSPVPGGEFGVPIPLVDLLDVLLARGTQGHRCAVYRL